VEGTNDGTDPFVKDRAAEPFVNESALQLTFFELEDFNDRRKPNHEDLDRIVDFPARGEIESSLSADGGMESVISIASVPASSDTSG